MQLTKNHVTTLQVPAVCRRQQTLQLQVSNCMWGLQLLFSLPFFYIEEHKTHSKLEMCLENINALAIGCWSTYEQMTLQQIPVFMHYYMHTRLQVFHEIPVPGVGDAPTRVFSI